jgi:salicylate hydroxylase
MNAWEPTKRLKVAVIGGGPGGLGAAIELSRLSFVDWNLYEKNPQFRETGGGITLQPHTWRLLERNGTAVNIESNDFFRPAAGLIEQRRYVNTLYRYLLSHLLTLFLSSNARNGKLLHEKRGFANVPLHHQTCRLARPRLQAALLKNVDHTRVHVGRKIIGVEQLADNRVEIKFADGFVDKVDLLVAADGIRSVGKIDTLTYRQTNDRNLVHQKYMFPGSRTLL